MATAQIASTTRIPSQLAGDARSGPRPGPRPAPGSPGRSAHGSTRADVVAHGRRNPLRTALRGAGVFLATALRVVLLGREGL